MVNSFLFFAYFSHEKISFHDLRQFIINEEISEKDGSVRPGSYGKNIRISRPSIFMSF